MRAVEITTQPGKTYMVTDELGRGAFGAVVRAQPVTIGADGQRVLGEPVALKIGEVLNSSHMQMEVGTPREMARTDTRIRAPQPLDAVRIRSAELEGDVGIHATELVDGQQFAEYIGELYRNTGDMSRTAAILSDLSEDYGELYERGRGVTDARGGNVTVARTGAEDEAGLVHIDWAAAGADPAEVYVSQMSRLSDTSYDIVEKWHQLNPYDDDPPLEIRVIERIASGIRSGKIEEFSDAADLFSRVAEAARQENPAWTRQQLRAVEGELERRGMESDPRPQYEELEHVE